MKGMLQGEYCLTPGCVKAAKALINNMDPSVDPCEGMLHVFCMGFYKDLTFEIVHWYSYTGSTIKKSTIIHMQLRRFNIRTYACPLKFVSYRHLLSSKSCKCAFICKK
jgi:hypothetical protein